MPCISYKCPGLGGLAGCYSPMTSSFKLWPGRTTTTTTQDRTTTKTHQAIVQGKTAHRISEYTALTLPNHSSTLFLLPWLISLQIWWFDSARISDHGELYYYISAHKVGWNIQFIQLPGATMNVAWKECESGLHKCLQEIAEVKKKKEKNLK